MCLKKEFLHLSIVPALLTQKEFDTKDIILATLTKLLSEEINKFCYKERYSTICKEKDKVRNEPDRIQ